MAKIRASAVIVAAGSGNRMKSDIKKQYISLLGLPLVAYAIKPFQATPEIDGIILVVPEDDLLFCKKEIVEKYGFNKIKAVVCGGDIRRRSVYNGLKALDRLTDIVLIHDGARPFITEGDISRLISAADEKGAAALGVIPKDTVKICGENGEILKTLKRELLRNIQTPQAFRYKDILSAHERAEEDGLNPTDDTALLEEYGGGEVFVIEGSYENIKITTPEDIILAEAILRGRGNERG